jgi:metallo-beta-lactamase family protein
MQITFLGATRTVTGSRYVVDDGSHRVLVDCGLFQGEKALRLRNWQPLPVPPASFAAVVLTHAHIDHSGFVPLLVRQGYRGRIHCSEATYQLCRILLTDSGRLQEEEAAYANRHGYSKHAPALPLYTRDDATRCLRQFTPAAFDKDVMLPGGIRLRLSPAGHILGASIVTLDVGGTRIVFSGDLGRPHDLIMNPPTAIAEADYLVVESTYGDRRHAPEHPMVELGEVINRTVARGGKVIVPSFAVGRAQELLYCIHLLRMAGTVSSRVPVYLDSPMATDVTALYRRFRRQHRLSPEACAAMCGVAQIVETPAASRRLDEASMPMVIIAASGMATGGRVLHHLRALAGDPRNTILFSGYQAAGTRGASIVGGASEVKMLGQMVSIRAEIAQLDGLSAHADGDEIIAWLGGFKRPPRRTFVTHGEAAAAEALRQRIAATLGWEVEVPGYLQEFALE